MSTILKALRRLESEKNAQAERPLREQVVSPAHTPRSWPSARVVLALAGGGVLGSGLLFWWVSVSDLPAEPATAVAEPVAATALPPPTPAASAPTEAQRSPVFEPPAAPPSAPLSALAEVATPSPDDPLAVSQEPVEEWRELPAAALASEVRIVERIEPPPEPAPAVARAEPVVEKEPAAPPKPTVKRPGSTRPSAWPSKPEVERATPAPETLARSPLPELVIERTEWHPLSERRLAVIAVGTSGATRELREGDAVGPLVVESIEPSGVVFLHEGVELRRPVGDGR